MRPAYHNSLSLPIASFPFSAKLARTGWHGQAELVRGVEWRELSGTDKRSLSLVSLVDRIVAFHGQTKFARATKDFVFVVFLWFSNFRHSVFFVLSSFCVFVVDFPVFNFRHFSSL
jgi:hypothetical protein